MAFVPFTVPIEHAKGFVLPLLFRETREPESRVVSARDLEATGDGIGRSPQVKGPWVPDRS